MAYFARRRVESLVEMYFPRPRFERNLWIRVAGYWSGGPPSLPRVTVKSGDSASTTHGPRRSPRGWRNPRLVAKYRDGVQPASRRPSRLIVAAHRHRCHRAGRGCPNWSSSSGSKLGSQQGGEQFGHDLEANITDPPSKSLLRFLPNRIVPCRRQELVALPGQTVHEAEVGSIQGALATSIDERGIHEQSEVIGDEPSIRVLR